MASFYAELTVGGRSYPVRHCTYEFNQASNERGRPVEKVRHGLMQLLLDVPDDDVLLDWGSQAYKPLDGDVTFFYTDQRTARESVSWEAGHCVGYHEVFASGDLNAGSYVCHVTIAAPKLTLQAGRPGRYVSPAPREHGTPVASLAPLPPSPLPPLPVPTPLVSPLPDKKARYAARMHLMQRAHTGLAATPNAAAQTALDRLTRDNVAVERARLSAHVYHSIALEKKGVIIPPEPEPEGWHMLDKEELAQLGVTPEMLVDPKSGFKAALYNSSFEQPPKLVVAYAGTEDIKDWKTNFRQGVGLKDRQYDEAMSLAKTVAKKVKPINMDITGHSLGGGLASAGSVVTGAKGYTFNAAGLHKNTVRRAPYGVSGSEMREKGALIDAYRSTSDPLNNLQQTSVVTRGVVLPHALGIDHPLTPAPQWQHKLGGFAHPLTELKDRALDGHGISPQMVDHIEHEKDQDAATLTSFLAP